MRISQTLKKNLQKQQVGSSRKPWPRGSARKSYICTLIFLIKRRKMALHEQLCIFTSYEKDSISCRSVSFISNCTSFRVCEYQAELLGYLLSRHI